MRLKILGLLIVLVISFAAGSSAVGTFQPLFETDTGGPCTKSSCQTTCTGPTGVECCCYYSCPSGNTWVCQSGYCENTSHSCVFELWP
jgi:hypothetical protein